ncbi:MAG TPA: hypothetical protein VL853_05995, partial [Gemmatimonadales bacterium]|nr:hypothetical protein [Gemmatimonadales bacterium]
MCLPGGLIADPVLPLVVEGLGRGTRAFARQCPGCAGLKQQSGVPTVLPVGAKHDRQSPGRGFEHGVETGSPETAPDVRHCARAIQDREHPDSIAQDNGVTFGCATEPHGGRQSYRAGG